MQIGTVPYINALPLTRYLDAPLVKKPPADLVPLLLSGEIDVALLPLYAVIKNNLVMHPDAGIIGCDGTVKSVGFFTRTYIEDLSQIHSIYMDHESLSSAYLGKIILKKFYGISLYDLEFFHQDNAELADAQLLIGDKALFFDHTRHKYDYWDIGDIWKKHTGAGFMFACWASRRNLKPSEISTLENAKNKGLANIEEIVSGFPPQDQQIVREYYTKNIIYTPNDNIKEGLKLYKDFLKEYHYSDPIQQSLKHHIKKGAAQAGALGKVKANDISNTIS